ncbi:Chain length determinant protein [Persephonella hydrogeniphila]|uniref:Chain length determinant protein n=1 Tax=Persephonella hydrogeniphila TaxID=198703 RepID=A0A285NB45_9AQUI|nr:Wzz/FepE/Etk N-terminal domain-containing protein [Persephonella hydrogeniphila]SNZ06133.1 Chain length determinant protein [Persephonella hydrogeniphila]
MEKLPKEREEQIVYYQEDEIDLYELWLTLKKRWKVIIATTFFFILVATIYILISPNLYKVEAYISPARIENKPAFNSVNLVNELKAKYQVDNSNFKRNELEKSKAYIDAVSLADRKNKVPIIKVEAIGFKNEYAISKIDDVLKQLKDKYGNVLSSYKQDILTKIEKEKTSLYVLKTFILSELKERKRFLTEEEIPILKKKLSFFQNELKRIDTLLSNYRKSLNNYTETIKNMSIMLKNPNLSDSSLLILSTQLANYQSLVLNLTNKIKEKEAEKEKILNEIIPNIEKKIKEIKTIQIPQINKKIEEKQKEIVFKERNIKLLEYKLKYPIFSDFEIISEIVSDKPYKPKKSLILAVASVSGLFLGIFLAFFLEWIENARKRHTTS